MFHFALLKRWRNRAWADAELPRYLGYKIVKKIMNQSNRGYFQPQQAREVADVFNRFGIKFMFIGKSGAILLGYPASTQDVVLFPLKLWRTEKKSLMP